MSNNPTNPSYTAETAHTAGAHTASPVGSANTTRTTGTTGTHAGAGKAGSDIGNMIKQGATQVHGLGEAIRGNINAAVDGATGESAGVIKNNNIAARGVDEVTDGQYRGHPESRSKH